MKRCDLRLVRINTQTVVSIISPSASSIVRSTWNKVWYWDVMHIEKKKKKKK